MGNAPSTCTHYARLPFLRPQKIEIRWNVVHSTFPNPYSSQFPFFLSLLFLFPRPVRLLDLNCLLSLLSLDVLYTNFFLLLPSLLLLLREKKISCYCPATHLSLSLPPFCTARMGVRQDRYDVSVSNPVPLDRYMRVRTPSLLLEVPSLSLSLIVNLPPSSSQSVELANQGQVRIYRRVYILHMYTVCWYNLDKGFWYVLFSFQLLLSYRL